MSESSSDVNPLDALAEEFVARHRRGERPPLDEFIARRPDLADDIRDLFPGLVLMEGVRPAPGDATGPFDGGDAVPMLKRLGDYRILREVGRGGMGVVYEAEQESLGRHVALKVLPAHALLDPQRLRRFHREAKAAARLHHTNIVPVYGVGEQDGLHYYVMQFIQGQGLDQVLGELKQLRRNRQGAGRPPAPRAAAESAALSLLTGRFASGAAVEGVNARQSPAARGAGGLPGSGDPQSESPPTVPESSGRSDTGPAYWASVARIGIQTAQALAYAAAQGTLHRDVKPSNLLLDAHGNLWVADFGLAKAADSEDLTHTGDIVGTLRYMAPERFGGRGDLRSDLYSLGLTLYELLALRPAFQAPERQQLVHQVLHAEPPRLRQFDGAIPRDLETIIHKAIDKDAARRYQTPEELADDLQRFVDDRPIRARRVSGLEKAWRWGRRNPLAAGLTALVVLLLLVGTAGSAIAAYYFSRLADAQAKLRADADHAKGQVQKQADELRDGIDRMNRANERMESGRLHADAGENELALADYNKAVELRPDMSAAWLARGQLYMRFYCWDEAASDFERGFALHSPADPNLWLSHACLRVYIGDADGYGRVCAAMLDKFGQTTDPTTALDIAYACTAGPDALPDYTRVIKLMDVIKADPNNPSLASERDVQLALLSFRSGRIDQAIAIVEDKAHDPSEHPEWNDIGFAAAYHRAGQDDKARKRMAAFTEKSLDPLLDGELAAPSENEQPGLLALHLSDYQRYRETLQVLDGAAAVEHPAAPLVSGLGHAALGQLDKATAALDRAVALRPDRAGLRLHRGRVFVQLSRWDDAAADFAHAVHAAPEDQRAAICDEIAAADPHLSAALIARWPDDAWVRAARARQRVAAGPSAWAEAEADYAKAIVLLPKEATFRDERARMYAMEGKWDKAGTDFDAALDLKEPEGESGWVEVLWVMAAAGDRDHFRTAADRMFALYGDSKNPVELQHTAESCLQLPDACADPKGCLRAAEKAYAADQGVWNIITLALVRYRDGQYEPVVPALKDCLEHHAELGETDRLMVRLLVGMAEHQLRHEDEARKWIEPAARRIDEMTLPSTGGALPKLDPWLAWAMCRTLRNEAAALLKEPAPQSGK